MMAIYVTALELQDQQERLGQSYWESHSEGWGDCSGCLSVQ